MSTIQTHVELKIIQTRLERSKLQLKCLEEEKVDLGRKIVEARTRIVRAEEKTEQEKADLDRRILEARAKIARDEEELKRFKKDASSVIVSEHAILRYIERVMGVDIDEIKKKILPPDVVQAISHFHGGCIPHPDGFTLRVRENTVTTITTVQDNEP